MAMAQAPIGVLDSGVGGVYVMRRAAQLLPREDFLFYGDLANAPYGTRSREEICRIAGDAARDLLGQGVKAILETIRAKHPEAKVLLHPIFPRGKTAQDGARKRNEAVNAVIRGYADGKDVLWHDFNAKFLDEKGGMKPGLMFPDDLHPDHNGYLVWRDELLPIFQKVLGK